jgi:hypothetical protein
MLLINRLISGKDKIQISGEVISIYFIPITLKKNAFPLWEGN